MISSRFLNLKFLFLINIHIHNYSDLIIWTILSSPNESK